MLLTLNIVEISHKVNIYFIYKCETNNIDEMQMFVNAIQYLYCQRSLKLCQIKLKSC